MLSSPGNQYLRPEYLTPLPTTLDAKKSPLALLAQTCSQIGADAPNAKLLQSAEKSSSSSKPSTKVDVTIPKDSKAQPIDYHHHHHKSSSSSSSNSSVSREKSRTPEERASSVASSRVRTPSQKRCASNQSAASPRASPKTPADSKPESERGSPSSKTAFTPNILTSSSDPAIKDLPLGTFKPGVPVPVSSAFLSAYPAFSLPMDLMASGLMAQHRSPYLSYARLKAGAECRDPYCTGCGMSSHVKTSPSCPAGCAQCDHAKPPVSSPYLVGPSPAAAAYAHAQLAALAAASHLPYVCNWIAGDAQYCGKRFSSSEELLSHLRTHTSAVAVSESSLASMHPLLHRTYPTPPLSPLATARYHPYGKPLLPPTMPGFPMSHPGLPPYLSPYSLYGPRLGAAPGMHP